MKTPWFGKQKMVSLALLLASCGGSGSKDSSTPATPGSAAAKEITVTGAIKSVSGSQSEMKDWVIAMVDYDSFVSAVAPINAAGTFTLSFLLPDHRYTLVLLDPQFKLASVLTTSSGDDNNTKAVRQVFKLAGTQLPTLVHNGPIINFTNTSGITWDPTLAADADGDLIPDGIDTALTDLVDTDKDGVPNITDPDIDGDGLLNPFDLNDDGDTDPDVFDADANGDGIPDANQAAGDLYFAQLLDFLSVQVLQETQSDGSFQTSLLFTTKVKAGGTPTGLKIRAASSLLEGALQVRVNPDTGDLISGPWDNSLADDGLNEDGAAGDGTYVRRVQLATGKIPKAQQVVFFQYLDNEPDTSATATATTPPIARVRELPFMFPAVTTAAISGTYDAATRKVTLSGAPFGADQKNFKWTVEVFDVSGDKVFSSEPKDGATTEYTIPTGVLEVGSTYTAKITATTPERIPSYPSWIVRSPSFNL